MQQIDLGTLQTIIEQVVDSQPWYVKMYIDNETLVDILVNIWLMNDTAIEVTNRVEPLTIIATTHRVSIIIDEEEGTTKRSTYYKSDHPLCNYANTATDIANVLNIIDVCIIRLNS